MKNMNNTLMKIWKFTLLTIGTLILIMHIMTNFASPELSFAVSALMYIIIRLDKQ